KMSISNSDPEILTLMAEQDKEKTSKMPISNSGPEILTLMAEQDKGKGVIRPSGSRISEPFSPESSSLAGPSNYSEGDKDERVGITSSDYEWSSSSEGSNKDVPSKIKKPVVDHEGNIIAYLSDSDYEGAPGSAGPSNPKKSAVSYTGDSDSDSDSKVPYYTSKASEANFKSSCEINQRMERLIMRSNAVILNKNFTPENLQKASKGVLEILLKDLDSSLESAKK